MMYQDYPICPYCDGPMNLDEPFRTSKDHIIPRSLGGKNSQANIVRCCHGCNSIKGNMTPNAMRAMADDMEAQARLVRQIAKRVDGMIVNRALAFGPERAA